MGAWRTCTLLALIWVVLARPAVAAPADNVDDATQPFALTISGGVSLGSYEAGVNWALLEILRTAPERVTLGHPALIGVTGASAGSINALMTAMHWCSRSSAGDSAAVDRNLFADAWLPIGLETLAPELLRYDDVSDQRPDALLTRNAFGTILARVSGELEEARYRPGCTVSIGLIVTRIVPGRTEEAGISAENQRFVIPLRVVVGGDGRIRFFNDTRALRTDLVGRVIHLRNPKDNKSETPTERALRPGTVIGAVLASSAFPLALGPVKLDYFSRLKDCGDSADRSKRYARCSDWFVDGGIFDNIPLGVAVAQAERPEVLEKTSRPMTYLYVDSGNTRRRAAEATALSRSETKAECTEERERPISRALGCWSRTLDGAVATARSYELHNVLSYNAWNRGSPWVARRAAARLRALAGKGAAPPVDEVVQTCLGQLEGPLQPIDKAARGREPSQPSPLAIVLKCKGELDGLRYRHHLATRLDRWAVQLEAARIDVDSTRLTHETARGAILRLVSVVPDLVGAGTDDGDPTDQQSVDSVAAEAHLLAADSGRERQIFPSRRFFPLASTYVFNFSGFLDPPLRRYDYYVGVYDAMHSTAVVLCERERRKRDRTGADFLSSSEVQECVAGWLGRIRARVHLTSGAVSRFLDTLAAVERSYWERRQPPRIRGEGAMYQILRALAMPDGSTLRVDEDDLEAMLVGLRREGYRPETAEMKAAMHDPGQWWLRSAEHVLARQGQLEEGTGMKYAMLAGERLMGTTALYQRGGLFVQMASIPSHREWDRAWQVLRLAPMHVASSFNADRSFEAAWQAGFAGGNVRFGLEPRLWVGHREANLDVGAFVSTHAMNPLKQLYMSSWGVSMGITTFGKEAKGLRSEIFVTSLITTLRLAIGRQTPLDPDEEGYGYITVGIAELPSSLYTLWHLPSFD